MFEEHALTVASYLNNSRTAVLLSAVEILEEQEVILDGRKKPRRSRVWVNYYQTAWTKSPEEVEKPENQSNVEAEMFWLRFRLPYPLFKLLLSWTKLWREKRTAAAWCFDDPWEGFVPGRNLRTFRGPPKHIGKALSCTVGFYAAVNDKTIVRFDCAVRKLRLRHYVLCISYVLYSIIIWKYTLYYIPLLHNYINIKKDPPAARRVA